MKEYASLTTAPVKKGNIFTVIIATVAKKKNASLGNSMLNHLGHVTLTLWTFFEIFTSDRYHRDMKVPLTPSGSVFMSFLKNDKLMIGGSLG